MSDGTEKKVQPLVEGGGPARTQTESGSEPYLS